MKTKIINGNILDSTAPIIAHQVNCRFVMGAGVAKAIRKQWPTVYEKYCEFGKKNTFNKMMLNDTSRFIGRCQVVFTELNGPEFRYIANLFGQEDYGNDGKLYTNYTALKCALYSLKRFVLYENMNSNHTVAFPYGMGCGLAGGDWDIVSKMIEDVFEDTNVNIEYWKLEK